MIGEYLDKTTNQYLAKLDVTNAKPSTSSASVGNIISNILVAKSQEDLFNTTGNQVCVMTDGNIRLTFGGCTTFAEMQSWVTNKSTQLVYKLATPQTYQLTPTQVKSLRGVNNIWADTGEVDVQIWTKEVTS
jgi:hypothetical protein